jgi:beta-glucosidase
MCTTVKHLVANEQEHFRQSFEWGLANALSANIDDRTMHELYLWPFGDAVKAGVASVMCSYNMVNNSYACGNSKLLNGLLRDEMGFQGFVMSDWLAQRGGVSTALAGLDVRETRIIPFIFSLLLERTRGSLSTLNVFYLLTPGI